MLRRIEGFHQDEDGEWVADLSCLHAQHVRHEPPFAERPWVLREEGRLGRIGGGIECPLCDRAELPDGLDLARVAGPFEEHTMPVGLTRQHRVAERTWGELEVLDGSTRFEMATEPPIRRDLAKGDVQAIPPAVPHRVVVRGRVRLVVRFLVAPT